MKAFLIILIILIILFLLWWFFCRKKKCCAKGKGSAENGPALSKEPDTAAEPNEAEAPEADEEPAHVPESVQLEAEPSPDAPADVDRAVPVKKSFLNFGSSKAEGFSSLHGYKRIVAINVETPNSENNRICNIGISVADGTGRRSSAVRVNPEVQLDDVPDGLTADDILNAPTFPQLWPELSALFEGSLVLAHNTAHDLNILKKVLKAYGLTAPAFDCACTYRTSRKFHPDFENHKLGTICGIYNIPLDTRDAVSHSDACLEIYRHLVDEGQPFFDEVKEFTLD